jgi:hypothetical protein
MLPRGNHEYPRSRLTYTIVFPGELYIISEFSGLLARAFPKTELFENSFDIQV